MIAGAEGGGAGRGAWAPALWEGGSGAAARGAMAGEEEERNRLRSAAFPGRLRRRERVEVIHQPEAVEPQFASVELLLQLQRRSEQLRLVAQLGDLHRWLQPCRDEQLPVRREGDGARFGRTT